MQINPYHANGLGEVFQMKFEFRLLIFLLILFRKYLLFSYFYVKSNITMTTLSIDRITPSINFKHRCLAVKGDYYFASAREASLRIRKTSIGYGLIVASRYSKTPENPPMTAMNSR
jgi:hypothetical protein